MSLTFTERTAVATEIEHRYFVSNLIAAMSDPDRTVLEIYQAYIPSYCLELHYAQNGRYYVGIRTPTQVAMTEVPKDDFAQISDLVGPVVRLRTTYTPTGEISYYLTLKGKRVDNSCPEFEYTIENPDCARLIRTAATSSITKTRCSVPYKGQVFEVDVFENENVGLVIAEVELESEDQAYEKPAWLGQRIPSVFDLDKKLSNYALSTNPISSWDALALSAVKYHGGIHSYRET